MGIMEERRILLHELNKFLGKTFFLKHSSLTLSLTHFTCVTYYFLLKIKLFYTFPPNSTTTFLNIT